MARDGVLLPGVAARLRKLARDLDITVMTSDTFGTAERALAGLPVELRIVRAGRDKRLPPGAIAIGNGTNDVDMFRAARLAIAVIGAEGAAARLLRVATIVVTDIRDALNLVANPTRLRATLRP